MKKNINEDYTTSQAQSIHNNSLQEKLVSASNNNINPNNNSLDNSRESSNNNTHNLIQKKSIFSTNSNKPKSFNLRLSRNVRWFIFCVLVLVTIMINMDHGTIPAATEEIKFSLNLGDDDLGYFGSLVFLGNIIGSLLSFSVINWINRKYLLLISLVLNSVLLFVFTLTDIKWILFMVRVLVGIFQAFVSIYMPVWCDQFGIKKRRPIMISIIQSGSPLGVVFGYLLTAYIKIQFIWTYSFQIQAVLSCVLALIILFIPGVYFSSTLNSDKQAPQVQDETLSNHSNLKARLRPHTQMSNQARISGNFSVYQDTSVIIGNQANGFFSNFSQIVKQRVFLLSALALSNLFFIITAIQYWGSGYEKKVLGVADENQIFLSFAIVCITSPTLGLFFGGIVSAKTGGYEAKHSILVCFVFGLLAGIASIPVPMTNDIFYFTLYLWLVLFFGGAILPSLIGIIMTSLPHHLRGSANSMTNLITNLFGYLPAPAVYGLIFEKFKETNDRLAMQVIIYSSFIGCFLLVFAMYFRYMQKAKEELMNMNNDRKTSLISANSNLTNNLAKFYNPNSAININNYEKGFNKDNEGDEESSSSNSNHSGYLNDGEGGENRENCSAKSGSKNSSSNSAGEKSKITSSGKSNNNKNKDKNKKGKRHSDDDFSNYLSSNDVKGNISDKSKNKERKNPKKSMSRNSFDVTLIEENSEVFNSSSQANLLVGKNYSQSAVSNSTESKNSKNKSRNNDKTDRSTSSNKNIENGLPANKKAVGANPNFNYNKYLQENVFNIAENEVSNGNPNPKLKAEFESNNVNENSKAAKNTRKQLLNAEANNDGDLDSRNVYGSNYSYLNSTSNNNSTNNLNLNSAHLNPVSIKTPQFNFVGISSNENFFLEEKDRLGNFPNLNAVNSTHNCNDNLGHRSKFALNSTLGNAGKKENDTEFQNKQDLNKNRIPNPSLYESGEDSRIKFSYESADNNRSEYSLFNPIKNNLSTINKNFEKKKNFEDLNPSEIKNSETEKELQINQNTRNASLIGKSNDVILKVESKEKFASYEQEEILISEQSVDFDNSKYNQDASFKKYDDYI